MRQSSSFGAHHLERNRSLLRDFVPLNDCEISEASAAASAVTVARVICGVPQSAARQRACY